MTTLELIAFLEYLEKEGYILSLIKSREAIAIEYQKQSNKPDWKEKFFNQNTKQ